MAAVSIRAVADAVGVTPPSIYLHFADKNELLFEVCEQHFQALDRALEEAAAGSDDPLTSLELRGRAYVRFGVENPEHYRILFMSRSELEPERAPEWLAQTGAFTHLADAVRGCMEAGLFRPDDPALVALSLWAGVHGLTGLLVSKPRFPWPPLDEITDRVLKMMLQGLLDPAARRDR